MNIFVATKSDIDEYYYLLSKDILVWTSAGYDVYYMEISEHTVQDDIYIANHPDVVEIEQYDKVEPTSEETPEIIPPQDPDLEDMDYDLPESESETIDDAFIPDDEYDEDLSDILDSLPSDEDDAEADGGDGE